MDSQGTQMVKKRKRGDDNEAEQAGEKGGNPPGLRRGAIRTRTIELDYDLSGYKAHEVRKLDILATVHGVERRVGEIWNVKSYSEAEKVKVSTKQPRRSTLPSQTMLDLMNESEKEQMDWEKRHLAEYTERSHLQHEEEARQEEARQKEEKARQEEEKARQEEKKALQEKKKALQEKKNVRREKKARLEEKKARQEKKKVRQEKKKVRREKKSLQEKKRALQEKKKVREEKK
ncbi:hypothetical protein CORC01_09243 [Colletotrichum orchidophilum]|uniref:Uncharacterized protein n=1 Tax=Colletotrichum orchidophilum TaxID=1209926 RepID=A0A1G4B264_9PEZI|nr:uncharacterized protein CORC01_09243 [Colletotrichum orchidophilum]OHE95510.1 hypothetical protein CORC01_09243 [Colletotrichum orchidophilum]